MDDGVLNLFVLHRWERLLHLQLKAKGLSALPAYHYKILRYQFSMIIV